LLWWNWGQWKQWQVQWGVQSLTWSCHLWKVDFLQSLTGGSWSMNWWWLSNSCNPIESFAIRMSTNEKCLSRTSFSVPCFKTALRERVSANMQFYESSCKRKSPFIACSLVISEVIFNQWVGTVPARVQKIAKRLGVGLRVVSPKQWRTKSVHSPSSLRLYQRFSWTNPWSFCSKYRRVGSSRIKGNLECRMPYGS